MGSGGGGGLSEVVIFGDEFGGIDLSHHLVDESVFVIGHGLEAVAHGVEPGGFAVVEA